MRDRILRTLEDLISIKSVASDNSSIKQIVDYVEDRLKNASFANRFEQNNKHAIYLSAVSERPRVLFAGHLDVVNAEPSQFTPVIKGDRLFGRGSLDMKGPDAVMIELAREIFEKGIEKSVGFLFTTDEEVGSENGTGYLVKNDLVSAKFVVIPDGGNDFELIIEGKGALHVKITCAGKSVHGSRPWEGINAIDKCLGIYENLKKLDIFPVEPCNIKEHWHNTINIGRIEGGDSVNRVPDNASVYLDIRFVPPWTVEGIKDIIGKYIDKECSMEVISRGETVSTPPSDEHLVQFKSVAEKVLGRAVRFGREHGATDARFFAEKGIPSVILYPVGANIHGKDEWVSISSLLQLYNIFERFVEAL